MTVPFDHRAFGRRLREMRIALGLTEEQAATAARRAVDTWRKYEETGEGHITGPLILLTARYGRRFKTRGVNLNRLFPRHREAQ